MNKPGPCSRLGRGLSGHRQAPVGDGRPPLRGRCGGGGQGRSPAAAVAGQLSRAWGWGAAPGFLARLCVDPLPRSRSARGLVRLHWWMKVAPKATSPLPAATKSSDNLPRFSPGRLKHFQKTVRTGLRWSSSVPIRKSEKTIKIACQTWDLTHNQGCDWNGSPEIRTQDQSVKSRVLYR